MKKEARKIQLWFVNDLAMDFSLSRIKAWFTKLSRIGHFLGYHYEPAKILIVALEVKLDLATTLFS